MVEDHRIGKLLAHAVLIVGVLVTLFPLWVAFVASTHPSENLTTGRFPLVPGDRLVENYRAVLVEGAAQVGNVTAGRMMLNSLVMALGITAGKVFVSFLAAFAIVFFRFPGRMVAFFLIFITLMLPVEVRIVPTYDVVSDVLSPLRTLLEATGLGPLLGLRVDLKLSLVNSYAGLILPLIASATAQGTVVVYDLVIRRRMIRRTRSAHLHRPLIRIVREVRVRNGAAQQPAGLQGAVAHPRRRTPLLLRQVLPHVLCQERVDPPRIEAGTEVLRPTKVELLLACGDPPRVAMLTGTEDHPKRAILRHGLHADHAGTLPEPTYSRTRRSHLPHTKTPRLRAVDPVPKLLTWIL